MKFWKCEFCKHDVGPLKQITCSTDFTHPVSCDNFELKTKMHPIQEAEWHKHEDLDRFLDALDMELFLWQRAMLHTLAFKRPLYFKAARGSTRNLSAVAMLLCAYEKYKEDNQSQN